MLLVACDLVHQICFSLELNNCINSLIENFMPVFHFTLLFGGRGGDLHIEVQAPGEGRLCGPPRPLKGVVTQVTSVVFITYRVGLVRPFHFLFGFSWFFKTLDR